MKKLFIPALILSMLVLLTVSCNKKSSSPKSKVEENGLTEEINNFVPDTLIQILESLGMPINRGDTPPDIGGVYLGSPFILLASNRPAVGWDIPGTIYSDYYVKFSNQNNGNLTISVDYVNGSEVGNGLGGFIVGTNNNFSVFSELQIVIAPDTAYILNLISGTIQPDGIADFYMAGFMIDNLGNPNNKFINNGEGRVFQDSDGWSEEIPSLPKRVAGLKSGSGQSVSTIKKF